MRYALFAIVTVGVICFVAVAQQLAASDEVMKIDEQFRVAKLNKDTSTLDRILADAFYETNQNGNSRNKTECIELFKSFPITSLTTDSADVRITGDTAVVTGSQTEHNSTGVDRMLYMRVYIRAMTGWQLLASMQFRNPKLLTANR
jgi:hypothetical protein